MPFTFNNTPLDGVFIIQPRIFGDERGFFMETYKESDFAAAGIHERFVQDNYSRSVRNVVRGLHFQRSPHSQGKLVSCIHGSVWDVAVDLRKTSPTYKQWYGLELNSEKKNMLYIPPGFAHGFAVLSETADFAYKTTQEYAPESDGGIRWNDPEINVEWPIAQSEALISEKDKDLPFLHELGDVYL